jgi:hypothetical protein
MPISKSHASLLTSFLGFLGLQQLLQHTALQLIRNAQADILAIHTVVLRHMLTQLLITHGLGGYRENVLLESPATAASSDLYIARYIIVNIVDFGK